MTYCRGTGDTIVHAIAESPPEDMDRTTGVEVLTLHYATPTTPCGQLEHHAGQPSTPTPSCPTATDGVHQKGIPAC